MILYWGYQEQNHQICEKCKYFDMLAAILNIKWGHVTIIYIFWGSLFYGDSNNIWLLLGNIDDFRSQMLCNMLPFPTYVVPNQYPGSSGYL